MTEPNHSILGTPPTPEPPKPKYTWVFWLIVGVIALAVAGIIVAVFAAHHVASNLTVLASPGQGGGALERPDSGATPFGGDGIPNTAYEDMTFDDILNATGLTAGSTDGDEFGAGVYRVGGDGIAAGLYYLGGSQTVEGHYQIFERDDDQTDRYDLDDSVIYFGNYFTDLEEGDVIAYSPGGDEKMHVQGSEPLDVSAPYLSGVYRVGIDIPAGSYTITVEEQSLADASAESGAFVMKDLDFNDGSIVSEAYVRTGGRQTVTVTDGQYLELYAAQAEPGAASDGGNQSSQGSTTPGGSSQGNSYHHPEEQHHTAYTAVDVGDGSDADGGYGCRYGCGCYRNR